MKPKKSWREKLRDSKGLPKVCAVPNSRWGGNTVVVPAPIEVDAAMRKVPRGKITTLNDIRAGLARKHNADIGCPITTGIFCWIAAHAAEEGAVDGESNTTPYWRTLKTGGELNPKYPGGIEAQKKHLRAEGHRIIAKGKRFFVADFERAVVS